MNHQKKAPWVCCDQCVEILGKKSTATVKTWMMMCEVYFNKGSPLLVEHLEDIPEHLKIEDETEKDFAPGLYLEENGFIITHETNVRTFLKIPHYSTFHEASPLQIVFCSNSRHR